MRLHIQPLHGAAIIVAIALVAFFAIKNQGRIAGTFGLASTDENASPSIPFLIKSFQAPTNLSHWTTNPDWHNKSFFNGYGKKRTK